MAKLRSDQLELGSGFRWLESLPTIWCWCGKTHPELLCLIDARKKGIERRQTLTQAGVIPGENLPRHQLPAQPSS